MEPALTGMKGNEMEFYAYESHASAYNEQRTPEDDVTIGSPPAPAGRVRGFDREEERDRWVKEGPTVILNSPRFPAPLPAQDGHNRAEGPGDTPVRSEEDALRVATKRGLREIRYS